MPLMKFKPTSAGRRSAVRVVTPDLHKGAPHAPLLEKQSKTGGRNHHGRITTRHIGGGHKQHYRLIDFKRDKEGIPARVERIEYDPNRTAHIALLCYVDGERRYIIAPKGLKAGDQVIAGSDAPIKAGNTLPQVDVQHGGGGVGLGDHDVGVPQLVEQGAWCGHAGVPVMRRKKEKWVGRSEE